MYFNLIKASLTDLEEKWPKNILGQGALEGGVGEEFEMEEFEVTVWGRCLR